jgi:hypothetical protein
MGIFKVARAVTREVSNARGLCPQCKGPLTNPWPAYPGASHEVCGSCAVR